MIYKSVSRRPDNLQDFIMQEESLQDEQRQSMINETISPRATLLLSDHVHVQHRNLNDNATYTEQIRQLSDMSSNDIGNIYGKTIDEIPNNNIMCVQSKNTNAHAQTARQSVKDNFIVARSESEANYNVNDKTCIKCIAVKQKRMWDSSSYAQKRRAQELVNSRKARHDDAFLRRNVINPNKQNYPNQSADYELNKHVISPNHESYKHDHLLSRNIGMLEDLKYKYLLKITIILISMKL